MLNIALNIGPILEFCNEHLVICRSISIWSSFFISEHKCWRVEHKVYFLRDNNYQSYLGLGAKKFKISVTIESGILLCNSCHFGVHWTHSLIKRNVKLEDRLNKYVPYQELSVAPNGLFWSNWFFWFRRRVIRCGEIIWGAKPKKTTQRYHAVVHEVNTVMSCVNIR